MTNFEYYKDEILEITNKGMDFGLFNDKPISCSKIGCKKCELEETNCSKEVFKWLYAEHIEKPKLTKKERAFLEFIGKGFLARDYDDNLAFNPDGFTKKGNYQWMNDDENCQGTYRIYGYIYNDLFDFIKWEDKEPWSIEDLLKLEVEE